MQKCLLLLNQFTFPLQKKHMATVQLALCDGDTEVVVELFELEGTLICHLVRPSCNEQGNSCIRVLKALSSLILNDPRDGASTTSPGNLC